MPVFFAVIGTPLYDFAAGCVLAANVFFNDSRREELPEGAEEIAH